MYIPTDPREAVGRIERAFRLVSEAAPVIDKIRHGHAGGQATQGRPGRPSRARPGRPEIITATEAALVCEAAAAREDAIQVDSFTLAEYQRRESVDATASGRRRRRLG